MSPSHLLKNKNPLIIIVGPTAVGKTSLAIALAREFSGEIISADSRQIYRFMDMGTAKPAREEQRLVPHHLIDIVDPDEEYSVALYQTQARQKILEIYSRNRIPFLVGGTGLYVRSIVDGLTLSRLPRNLELRKSLEEESESKGLAVLYDKLKQIDPLSASRLLQGDRRRIIRALEIYETTGVIPSKLQSQEKPDYALLMIGLWMDRPLLYQKINERVDWMISSGLVEEVQSLLNMGYSPDLPSMSGLGYRQIAQYLKGEITIDRAIYLIKRDTRHYAKRQLTWFRPDERIQWFKAEEAKPIFERVKNFLNCLYVKTK